MHCAAINPNGDIIKKLIENGGDIYAMDQEGRQVIYYAAACESAEPLKVIMAQGAQVDAQIKGKLTPLHIAAKLGWTECVWEILKTSTRSLNVWVKQDSMTPLGYAC